MTETPDLWSFNKDWLPPSGVSLVRNTTGEPIPILTADQHRGLLMNDMQDFQDRGEPIRQRLGIDGTAGDAQDVEHPFFLDEPSGGCLVCGLARDYRKHVGEGE
jgi:hypothetical protein